MEEGVRDNLASSLILGSGGEHPGVSILSPGDELPVPLLTLPQKHSVYALSVRAAEGRIVAGTRSGTICVFQAPDKNVPVDRDSATTLVQGSPVLAVCLGEGDTMVSCDTSGRCLFWRELSNQRPPKVLQLNHAPLCSILGVGDDQIAGLCPDGNLLFLDANCGKMLRAVPCPRPIGIIVMARLEHWPAYNAIAFPAEDGYLAVCRLDDLEVSTVSAHAGDFFAVAGPDDSLLTIGKDDGLIRVWPAPGKPSSASLRCPKGTLCGRPMPGRDDSLILIDQDGNGRQFAIANGGLHLVRGLGPQAFRSVASASSRDRQQLAARQRQQAARGLQQQIQEKLDAGETEGIDKLHQHLVDTGFPLVSCGLKVEQAVREQDPLAELNSRRQMMSLLPADEPGMRACMLGYAETCRCLWLLDTSAATYAKLADCQQKISSLADLRKLRTLDQHIVAPELPIHVLIKAAILDESPFAGRWLVHSSPVIRLAGLGFSPEALVDKYNQVREERSQDELPDAKTATFWWLSPQAHRQREAVLFAPRQGAPEPHLCHALIMHSENGHDDLTPVILFHATSSTFPIREHNSLVLRDYERLTRGEAAQEWPGGLRQTVIHAIRRLRNLARSRMVSQEPQP